MPEPTEFINITGLTTEADDVAGLYFAGESTDAGEPTKKINIEKSINMRAIAIANNVQLSAVSELKDGPVSGVLFLFDVAKNEYYESSEPLTGTISSITEDTDSVSFTINGVSKTAFKATGYKLVISDISEFVVAKNKKRAKLISWHKYNPPQLPYTESGGDYIYMSDYPRSLHNGGTVINPTVPVSNPMTDKGLEDFINGVGGQSGNGVWLRVDHGLNISCFGASPYKDLFCDLPIEKYIETQYVQDTAGGTGSAGCAVYATRGDYKIKYPIVFKKDYIKFIGPGQNDVAIWKPGKDVRTDLGTNVAPNRDDVGGVTDSYEVDAIFIYTHHDNAYRYGCGVKGVRFSGIDTSDSLKKYTDYGIYAPRAALCEHSDISATRVNKLYFTHDTWKHDASDLQTNYGGGVFYYETDSSGKIASGTSLNAVNCFASRPLTEAGLFPAAYAIAGLEYSTMTACSADNSFEPWRIKDSNLDISSGSTEIARSTAAFVVDGGNVTFTNLRTVAPAHTGQERTQLLCKGGAKVKLIGGKMSNRANPDPADIGVLVTDGAELITEQFEFPTTGIPYRIDLTSVNPAKSAAITDEFGVTKIYDASNPDGIYNVPKSAISINTLLNKDSIANTRHKYPGREFILTQDNKTVTSTGYNPEDAWVYGDGQIAVTPQEA